MKYAVYKLKFLGAVHFGQMTLESSVMTFTADRLFSALAIEAISEGEKVFNDLTEFVKSGKLIFSDAYPFEKDEYFCPKPMMRLAHKNTDDDIKKRKIFKKLEYIPVKKLGGYLSGAESAENLLSPPFGKSSVKTSVCINSGAEPKPFRVGTFSFYDGCGLCVLIGYEEKENLNLAENLLERLSLSGIGGKRSSGLGRFELDFGKISENWLKRLSGEYKTYMTLSAALPADDELFAALEGANYLLEKKSGFVASANYAPEWRRKRDIFAFKSGSCFKHKFHGQLKDVSEGGNHPVYRYLEPMFMGVE